MANHNIAVIGAGISGLAASAFLKEQGFNVTIFERFAEPRPIGAGLVLQPTGLAVLANLGLDKQAIQLGAQINHFQGKTFGGKTVFNLSYKNLSPDYFGLGIHRHSIFQLLHEKIKSLSIPIINRFCASDIKNENNEYTLISKDNVRSGSYDLIIDASGARSVIRDKYAKVQFNRPLAYGALWAVCEDERQRIGKNILKQRVHQAKLGIGLIPIGKKPEAASKEYIAFHWSMRNKDYDKWRNTSFAKWKNEVTNLWGLTKYLVAQFNDHNDLTWAVYNDIVLKQFYTDRIVFIGDAGH